MAPVGLFQEFLIDKRHTLVVLNESAKCSFLSISQMSMVEVTYACKKPCERDLDQDNEQLSFKCKKLNFTMFVIILNFFI
jgi:hypothetical protein